ncbi:MAG: hypothetical protein H0W53_23415 [Acidobacteria bacterium]|jgi:hypothetical protein|nr:hypothetical protein [Acidobacteriota bacterium]
MCNQHDRQPTDRRSFLKVATAGSLAVAAGSLTTTAARAQAVGPEQAEQIIQDWPETATMAAKAMIEKYGAPAEATPSLLIWYKNGPWKRTVVYKEEIDHDFPMPHKDVLEQFIDYEVPPDYFDDLAHYDGSVIVERTKGEISARCDKEGANFLALNLANDIVKGNKSVEEARQSYGEAMMQMMQGSPPESTQKLTFDVPEANVGDSDEAIIDKG